MAAPQKTLTLPVDPEREPHLRAVLVAADFDLEDAPHAFWRGRGPGCIATLYLSGKLVVQGPNAEALASVLGLDDAASPRAKPRAGARAAAAEAALAKHPDPKPAAWIGSDEVGKGDYFGPLVVVAARVERTQVPLLVELGVADSKTLTDGRMKAIAKDVIQVVTHRAVVIGPEAYNRLYAKLANLNQLLAWAHARALEDVLAEASADYALVDRFAHDSVLRRHLKGASRQIRLDQRPRAEDDPAVATASILARVEFLRRMDALSREAGLQLPRGAGAPVLAAGRRLVASQGASALSRFAKLHFRTTEQICRGQ